MFKRLLLLIAALVLIVGYENCSLDSTHEQFSNVSSLSCDAIRAVFLATYYPVFRSKCVACHDNGSGSDHFANADPSVAFAEFLSKGRSRVEQRLVDPTHQPGHTGPENQALVNSSATAWAAAEGECSPNSNPSPSAVVRFSDLVGSSQTLGIFNNSCVSCHNASSNSGGLDLTSYRSATAKASSILSRMKGLGLPMPPQGLLPAAQIDVVQNWIANGTKQ